MSRLIQILENFVQKVKAEILNYDEKTCAALLHELDEFIIENQEMLRYIMHKNGWPSDAPFGIDVEIATIFEMIGAFQKRHSPKPLYLLSESLNQIIYYLININSTKQ
jgi:hypothetical protein